MPDIITDEAVRTGEPVREAPTPKKTRKKKGSGPIGEEEVREAADILQRYKNGKANLEAKVIDNEQWWKLQHWNFMRNKAEERQLEPTSAWLFNAIANKHADAMDNFPALNVLPRERSDIPTATALTEILPAILERNDFEQTYSDVWWYKLKTGTGVYGVFWNSGLDNGLGDIDIRKMDLLNLFWEPGITDIQASQNFFSVELRDNDLLKKEYPKLDFDATPSVDLNKYIYDENIDTSDKSAVVDWYYKKTYEENGEKWTVLHYCKFVNEQVLYASENDPEYAKRGYYDHGQYPFVFDVLYPVEGSPAGFGYIDIMKNPQAYIDKLDQAILENALVSSRKRFFVRRDGSIDEEEMADLTKPFVHTDSNLGEDSIREINYRPLSNIYYNVKLGKVDELKETAGNRDFSQGSVAHGVTAASAISALMEAGSKLSRDMNKASYRADKAIGELMIELIRQFYTEPRVFRITGEVGYSFTTFDNSAMVPGQDNDFGLGLSGRLPIFDLKVVPEKQTTFSRMSQNELALQLYGQGFFSPENATPALSCLEMMEFEGKREVIAKVAQGQTLLAQIQQLQDQMMQMAAIIDSQNGTNMTQNLGASLQQSGGQQLEATPSRVNLDGNKTLAQKYTESAAEQAAPR